MRWLLISIFLLLAGCGMWWVDDQYDPTFDIPATMATTPYEVCRWVDLRVRYLSDEIHDESEYWQSPDQTYEWGRGDCEDYVILVMYLIHRDLGGWPELVGGDLSTGRHAWVGYEGRWYEAQNGADVTDDPSYQCDITIAYGEVMRRSETWHRSVAP